MPTKGKVNVINIRRSIGKVVIRNFVVVKEPAPGATPGSGGFVLVEKPIDHEFVVYFDGDADMIDPTEMVRRNWLIGLLNQAIANDLEVTIEHGETAGFVDAVILHARETAGS